jgi:hypothetical protein
MVADRTESETIANQGHSENWSQIAASAWHPAQNKVEPREVVVKPVEVNGQVIHFPVTICPPGTASGLEKPKPRPIVQGGSCSPR